MSKPKSPPQLPPHLRNHIPILLIDNFDSFTWNLYQSLSLISPSSNITVIRNDAITPSQLPLLSLDRLIISPGPGHPHTDSGISNDAIRHFAGKIPILGVCMGLECIVDVFGGKIEYAGEIKHGKTSPIIHDARGIFHGLPQSFSSTRYHSLAAKVLSLPPQLQVCAVSEESGVIMGVRHREYTIEGVQYHPESAISEEGDTLLRNFLRITGGKWDLEGNLSLGVKDVGLKDMVFDATVQAAVNGNGGANGKDEEMERVKAPPSILQKIYTQRLKDVQEEMKLPGQTTVDLERALALGLAPPTISFIGRLREGIIEPPSGLSPHASSGSPPVLDEENITEKKEGARVRVGSHDVPVKPTPPSPSSSQIHKTPPGLTPTPSPTSMPPHPSTASNAPTPQTMQAATPALLAEIKRASPSKGLISSLSHSSAPRQALAYAMGGASAISVLTEGRGFQGSLEDLHLSRLAVSSLPARPAILRKDFILHPYQVLQSRLAGADAILLIVSMLPEKRLRELWNMTVALGMECLVEVVNKEEVELALSLLPTSPPQVQKRGLVIGINNRNLHTFEVDMNTTTRVAQFIKEKGLENEVIVCALSGINSRDDVLHFVSPSGGGVRGILVGESLMRSAEPRTFISELLGHPVANNPLNVKKTPLVKICGITSSQDAEMALKNGADLIGMVFVTGSKRCVSLEIAREISNIVREYNGNKIGVSNEVEPSLGVGFGYGNAHTQDMWFSHHARNLETGRAKGGRALVVGVFQNSPLDEIIHFAREARLDMVQLHGDEPIEWARWIGGSTGCAVIKMFGVPVEVSESAIKDDVKDVEGEKATVADVDQVEADEKGKTEESKDDNKLVPPAMPLPEPQMSPFRTIGYHHFVLLDSAQQGSGKGGGLGIPFDWGYARGVIDAGEIPRYVSGSNETSTSTPIGTDVKPHPHPFPLILAGGLTPTNVAQAIKTVQPWAVDVSSGVEFDQADGQERKKGKDEEKVRNFIKAVREAWVEEEVVEVASGEEEVKVLEEKITANTEEVAKV